MVVGIALQRENTCSSKDLFVSKRRKNDCIFHIIYLDSLNRADYLSSQYCTSIKVVQYIITQWSYMD